MSFKSILLCVALFGIPILAQAETYNLTFSPASWDFGNVQIGQSPTKTFTLTNSGTGAVTFINGTPTVPSAYGMSLSASTCGSGLASGASCELTATYAPAASGNANVSMYVSIAESTDQFSAWLTGNAVSNPTPPLPNPIPTLNEWAKIMMILMLLTIGKWSRIGKLLINS